MKACTWLAAARSALGIHSGVSLIAVLAPNKPAIRLWNRPEPGHERVTDRNNIAPPAPVAIVMRLCRQNRIITCPPPPASSVLELPLQACWGLGLALLLMLSVVIPADTVRDAVKAQIRAVTGLDPMLRGDVSVSLFPTGSVRFNDVSLGDNRTGAPALSAQQLLVRLRFFPFLFGRIEIADVTLVRPTIMIAFAADGSSNWAGHIDTLAQALTPSPDRIKIVLGNPHHRRHRDHPRRGLPI